MISTRVEECHGEKIASAPSQLQSLPCQSELQRNAIGIADSKQSYQKALRAEATRNRLDALSPFSLIVSKLRDAASYAYRTIRSCIKAELGCSRSCWDSVSAIFAIVRLEIIRSITKESKTYATRHVVCRSISCFSEKNDANKPTSEYAISNDTTFGSVEPDCILVIVKPDRVYGTSKVHVCARPG
jgi:hypothetical protein